jgi:hypothetical protein
MSKQEWLEVMMPHIVGDLKRQVGFSLSTGRGPQGSGSMTMVQFAGNNDVRFVGRGPAFRQEVPARVWLHDEIDWRKGKHEPDRIIEGGVLA